jgi:hypothetical protein
MDEIREECPRWVAPVGLRYPSVVGKMEAVHGFGGGVSPTGVVAGKLRVALRGKLVDGVRAPQGVHVSEDAGVELPVVPVCFAAESVGPDVGRGANIPRADADVVGVDELPEFSKHVYHSRGPRSQVTEDCHHGLVVFVHEDFAAAQEW